jgi:DNA-binding transcriptional regulator LsrR (DeoR family)
MPSRDELRLLARVARLYYTDGLRQPEIASRLDLSQARVSRLLKRAEAEGIVRITVTAPAGVFPELEEELQQAYGLKVAFVVDAPGGADNEDRLLQELGAAAAYYLEAVLRSGDVMGISSWSSSLLATADAMRPLPKLAGVRVVQILGGVGNPSARLHANRLTHHFAELVNGEAVTLPSPGIAGSAESAQVLRDDAYVAATLDLLQDLSLVLVGIGALRPSRLLASSGNVFSRDELEELSSQGAVGDICLRFFDAAGHPVAGRLDERVIGIQLDELKAVGRCIAVAGGTRKTAAIRAALLGGWVNTLITDLATAEALLRAPVI